MDLKRMSESDGNDSDQVVVKVPLKKRRVFESLIRVEILNGRNVLVANRNIQESELLFKERPIIGAPLDSIVKKEGAKTNICLSCCNPVVSNYKCSKCGFPMCDVQCENNSDHSEYECPIFANNHYDPSIDGDEYTKIKVLRCLLLKSKDPLRWMKLMDLNSNSELRSQNFNGVETTITFSRFINRECLLKEFNLQDINHIVGINTVHSYNYSQITKSSLIFYNGSFLSHSCIPNTRSVISKTGNGASNFQLNVYASISIAEGEVLSTSYVDGLLGTFQRRSKLIDSYYISCTCSRCTDPSEHSTFISALKCPKCSEGYLLPRNAINLDLSSLWSCTREPYCNFIITNSQVLSLLQKIENDIENTFVNDSLLREYNNLSKLLDKYSQRILHPNHFYVLKVSYKLITVISQLLQNVHEDDAPELAIRQVSLCKSFIKVIDSINPGNNKLRGNLLYYFYEGLLIDFLFEAKSNMNSENQDHFKLIGGRKFQDIFNIMELCKECLILEPVGSEEHNKATKLSDESNRLQNIRTYFNTNMNEETCQA